MPDDFKKPASASPVDQNDVNESGLYMLSAKGRNIENIPTAGAYSKKLNDAGLGLGDSINMAIRNAGLYAKDEVGKNISDLPGSEQHQEKLNLIGTTPSAVSGNIPEQQTSHIHTTQEDLHNSGNYAKNEKGKRASWKRQTPEEKIAETRQRMRDENIETSHPMEPAPAVIKVEKAGHLKQKIAAINPDSLVQKRVEARKWQQEWQEKLCREEKYKEYKDIEPPVISSDYKRSWER